MVFDGTCWATDAGTGCNLPFVNADNPVHRRPKIDFFDTASLNMNAISDNRTNMVSHLSSNGYYGYAHVTGTDTSAIAKGDDDVMDEIHHHQQQQQCEQQQQQQQHQQHHRQQVFLESRKRDRCHTENLVQAKRIRCAVESIEDVQMCDDDPFAQQQVPVLVPQPLQHHTPVAFGMAPAELTHIAGDIFRHRDLQNSDSKKVHNERVPTSHLSTMLVSPPKTNATFVVRKPMAPAILLSHTQPKSNASTEVDEDNQMASLCWHTHGSSFWHHLLITAEHVDSI